VGVETSSVGGEGEKAGGRRRKARAWWSEREAAVPLCVVSAAGKMLDGLEAEAARLALAGSGWLWLAVSLSLSLSRRETGGHYSQAQSGSNGQRPRSGVWTRFNVASRLRGCGVLLVAADSRAVVILVVVVVVVVAGTVSGGSVIDCDCCACFLRASEAA
jgi:hypothetical protein